MATILCCVFCVSLHALLSGSVHILIVPRTSRIPSCFDSCTAILLRHPSPSLHFHFVDKLELVCDKA
jgi:hypothetical protein